MTPEQEAAIRIILATSWALPLDQARVLMDALDSARKQVRQLEAERDGKGGWKDVVAMLRASEAKLEAQVARMREALQPFTALLHPHHDNYKEVYPVFEIEDKIITVGDLKRAMEVSR